MIVTTPWPMGWGGAIIGSRAATPTTPEQAMSTKQVASEIEAQIRKGCGAAIEWTFRTADRFTISGDCVAVNRAVLFCIEHGLCRIEDDTVYDPELDQSFAYLKAA
jgi:hypothetical protein